MEGAFLEPGNIFLGVQNGDCTEVTRQKPVASARPWAAQAPRQKSPETYKNRKAPPAGWGALQHPPSNSFTGVL